MEKMNVQKNETNDALEQCIVERLGERQKKLQRIEEWEQADRRKVTVHRRMWMTVLAAACVAGVLVVTPLLRGNDMSVLDQVGIGVPDLTECYRAADPDLPRIQRMMNEQKWDEALKEARTALRHSNEALELFTDAAKRWGHEDEGILYDIQAEEVTNDELHWTYIYLLLRTGHDAEASVQLKEYLRKYNDGVHRNEALTLQEKMKN